MWSRRILLPVLIAFLVTAVEGKRKVSQARLTITNGCESAPMWIAHMAGAGIGPDPQNILLQSSKSYQFTIPDGLQATRYWPKMGCDSDGNACTLGGSGGPGQKCNGTVGCAPPIDTKFEATWGVTGQPCNPGKGQYAGCDWFDVSLVDGFTLPFKMEVSQDCNLPISTVDCSHLSAASCPTTENLGPSIGNLSLVATNPTNNQTVGCYSPCSKLTFSNWKNPVGNHPPSDAIAAPYCCPTPPISPKQCREGVAAESEYVKAIHQMCPHVYGYSYDDGIGLQTCPAGTTYSVTFYCPADMIGVLTNSTGSEVEIKVESETKRETEAKRETETGGKTESKTDSKTKSETEGETKTEKKGETLRTNEKLIFSEDFNRFDLRTWTHEITASGGGNWEFEWYGNNRANNSFVENGTLFLQATLSEEFFNESPTTQNLVLQPGGTFPDQCTDGNDFGCRRQTAGANIINPIQSARVSTKNSFSFRYGRVEAKAKLPKGDWLWPAIWMLPRDSTYGLWPASGEIDILESRGNKASNGISGIETMQSTLHWGPKFSENQFHLTHVEKTLPSGEDFSQDFHVFGLYWNSTTLYTYLDDPSNKVLVVDLATPSWVRGDFEKEFGDPVNPWRHGTTAAPFDEEFYIILNLACGGTGGFFPEGMAGKPWNNLSPTAPSDFYNTKSSWYPTWTSPALVVDSIKVWALEETMFTNSNQRPSKVF
ncbi:hypothetical protein AAMO2058_000645800 [Amorphochlora amoebiformis]